MAPLPLQHSLSGNCRKGKNDPQTKESSAREARTKILVYIYIYIYPGKAPQALRPLPRFSWRNFVRDLLVSWGIVFCIQETSPRGIFGGQIVGPRGAIWTPFYSLRRLPKAAHTQDPRRLLLDTPFPFQIGQAQHILLGKIPVCSMPLCSFLFPRPTHEIPCILQLF